MAERPAGDATDGAIVDEIIDGRARDLQVIHVENTLPHLNAVAGQADDALDIVGTVVRRQLEDRDIATFRQIAEETAAANRRAERQGMP